MSRREGRTLIRGSFVAIVTPFDAAGEIDFGAFKTLVEFQQQNGTNALFFMGTAGELPALTEEEQRRIVVETAKWKTADVPFFYGCTGANTQHTIQKVRFAEENGADGAMLTVPAATGPTQEEAERYFLTIADSTNLPLGTYNNPARLMTDLQWENLLRVFAHPRYVAHKEGTPRSGQAGQILRAMPDIAFLADDEPDHDILVCGMALGAAGISNAAGNLAPAELAALARPWTETQDVAAFRSLYFSLRPLMSFIYSARSPKATKALMNAVGLPAGHPRLPLQPLPEEQVRAGVRILEELGLIEKYGLTAKAA